MARRPLRIGEQHIEPENLKKLLDSGHIEVDAVDSDGKSALHHAIDSHDNQTVRLLVEANADVNLRDRWGNNPLWRAIYHTPEMSDIVALLLDHGAQPAAKNNHGASPLDLATSLADHDDEAARLLRALEAAAHADECHDGQQRA
jgi:ankyrin repeat protein